MWAAKCRRSATLSTIDLRQKIPARVPYGVNVPKIMLFFSAIKQARRRARSEHRPKDWMGSADRARKKLSICVEKPQCARRFQACAPQTCGFISSAEIAHQCARPAPTQPRPKEWLGISLIRSRNCRARPDSGRARTTNAAVEKHVQGTLSRLLRILSAARAACPPANPPGARPPLCLPARPPERRARARAHPLRRARACCAARCTARGPLVLSAA